MAALTFEKREVLLTLAQTGSEDDAPILSLKLRLTSTRPVYLSNGKMLRDASWTMVMRAGPATLPGSLTYSSHAGKGECQLLIDQSPDRFAALVALFKGGHASEVTIVTEGLTRRDDYSSQWDIALQPRLDVLRVSVEFPLPQSEA